MAGNSKNALLPYHLIVAGDMSGDVTSNPTNIQFLDNCSVEIDFTGSPTGTFTVEGSLTYKANALTGVQQAPGFWIPITLSPIPIASGSSGQILIDMDDLSFPWIRVVYHRTGGTGTLDVYISGKSI